MNKIPLNIKLENRVRKTKQWLDKKHPECQIEQAHLNEDAPERAYWHYGYYVALTDVLNLMEKELSNSI